MSLEPAPVRIAADGAGAAPLAEYLDQAGHEAPGVRPEVLPTGYRLLDSVLEGGVRAGDLSLIGGRPGIGKTVAVLQWARSMALSERTAAFLCYEHQRRELFARLLLLELGTLPRVERSDELGRLRVAVREFAQGARTLGGLLDEGMLMKAAYSRIGQYAEHLWLLRDGEASAELDGIEKMAANLEPGSALVLDYLQKISVGDDRVVDEGTQVTMVAEALKEAALRHRLAVVAVVAADRQALGAGRIHLHHLRGSSALAYESDLVIMLNEKAEVVPDALRSFASDDSLRRSVVMSIEKNRGGQAGLDLVFDKDFAYYRFDPEGTHLTD